MISVTLDSNIYISALIFDGTPLRILKMAQTGLIRLDISDTILEEFGGVLRDKFHWDADDIAQAQRSILSFANQVAPTQALTVIKADADDDRILECAAAAHSDYVVTGDKHLLAIGTHQGSLIVKPTDFLTLRADL